MKLMCRMLMNVKVFSKLIILFLMGLARHVQITWVNLQYLCDILRNKSGMMLETTLTIYYPFNVLPPLILFLSQNENHTQPFLHLTNCVIYAYYYGRAMQISMFCPKYAAIYQSKEPNYQLDLFISTMQSN